MRDVLPVVVIGGYLGAGKTTLVNHLLRQAQGRRIAVLVNDFGDIAIDAELIERSTPGQRADVLSLTGGCLCCSFGSDLVGTLRELLARDPRPDTALIELSGVALPDAVRQTLQLVPDVALQGTLVLADAVQLRRQAGDRYVGDTVMRQLQAADLLLLNKAERADGAALQSLQAWLRVAVPDAPVLVCAADEVAPELVLDLRATADDDDRPWTPTPQPAASRFASRLLHPPDGVDLQALSAALCAADSGVLRAKGWLRDTQGQGVLLQLTGSRCQITPAAFDGPARLVLIGLRAVFDAPGHRLPL